MIENELNGVEFDNYIKNSEERKQTCDMYYQEIKDGKVVNKQYTIPEEITQEMLDEFNEKVAQYTKLSKDEIMKCTNWMLGKRIPLPVPESLIEKCVFEEPKEMVEYVNSICEQYGE